MKPFLFSIFAFSLAASAQPSIKLHDASRNRDIPLKVYLPAGGGGPVPLIIFSHGFGASKNDYGWAGEAWARAGYVVMLPSHADSDTASLRPSTIKIAKQAAGAFQMQVERVGDISYVISALPEIERDIPGLAGRVDASRIGISGHSMGAGTALLVAGATSVPPGGARRVFRDARVMAAIAMSPQGPGEEGFDEHSWDDIRIPTMTMSGTKDKGQSGNEQPPWRVVPFEHMRGPDQYHVLVKGAHHLTFAIAGPAFRSCLESETIAFWDAYLKKDASARAGIVSTGRCTVQQH